VSNREYLLTVAENGGEVVLEVLESDELGAPCVEGVGVNADQ
jgi:hypothetical protein